MKKLFYIFFMIFSLLGCTKTQNIDEKTISIVTTNFPCYDFTRNILSEIDENFLNPTKSFSNAKIKLLIKPGMETHSYDPTPKDILDIQNADIFIRMGGHSEIWVDKILNNSKKLPKKIIKLQDYVENSHHHDESHNAHEHDEHFWTNSNNAIKFIKIILENIIEVENEKNDGKNNLTYTSNANKYILQIQNMTKQIQEVVDNSENKLLIFGDRFPFAHFVEQYGLNYESAFDGCSSAVEAKTSKIAHLIDIAKEKNIKTIFAIEMSNKKIANSIAQAVNGTVLELHSCQNVTKDDFEKGITYLYTMKVNLEALKKSL